MSWKVTNRSCILFAVLLVYHLSFSIFNWNYFAENGGDASFYWFQTAASASKSFSDLKWYGSDLILLLNYPLAEGIGLDIRWGFFIYSLIGYLGIVQFYRLCAVFNEKRPVFQCFNVYLSILLLPNLHFWTAGLGKEALCFLCIATLFFEIAKGNFKSAFFVISAILLILIRPHYALLVLFSIAAIYLFNSKLKLKKRLAIGIVSSVLLYGLFYIVLQLSEIKRMDFDRIARFNEYSLLSFKHSGSYVPIIEYSYPYKIFTFFFRPLLNEIPTFFGIVLGIENLLVLLLHCIAFIWFCFNYKRITFQPVHTVIVIFTLISAIVFVQRYSGFGIFARTKVMMQPFMCLVLVWILSFRKKEIKSE